MENEMDTCKDPFLFMHMQPSNLLEYKRLRHLKFKKKKMVKKKKEELMKKRSFLGLTLLLLLIASQETEARLCESQSHSFKGLCLSNHNCAVVCRNEHFVGGRCRGARRRCFCTRNC